MNVPFEVPHRMFLDLPTEKNSRYVGSIPDSAPCSAMLTPISSSDWIFWNEFQRFLGNTAQRCLFLEDCNPGRLCSDPFLDEGYAEMVVHQGDAKTRHLPE